MKINNKNNTTTDQEKRLYTFSGTDEKVIPHVLVLSAYLENETH